MEADWVNTENGTGPATASPAEVFLATMFSGGGHASASSGLLIASSMDGVFFRNVCSGSRPVYAPSGGVRDPSIVYREGQWHLVYSYGPNVAPLLFLAVSPDLLHWTPVGSLRLAADAANNFVDVPQWIADQAGGLHLIACTDDLHHWVEIHPLSPDPLTWGDQAYWSAVTTITDHDGEALVQGNSFVAVHNGTYYMAFNDAENSVYYMRTSANLTSGWSAARQLNLDSSMNGGDSGNLVFLSDGSLRFYISNGNSLKNVIWYVDSADLGVSWTPPRVVSFAEFGTERVNWTQIVRVTDPVAIATMVATNQVQN
jgi:hypothetical protein